MKYFVFLTILVSGMIFAGGYFLTRPPKVSKNYDAFAKCLAEKKLTMYGAYWCPHCQAEKKNFGGSFKYVPYVECTQETKKCLDAGISGYPTWIDADGKKYEGGQELSGLSKISGCELPSN